MRFDKEGRVTSLMPKPSKARVIKDQVFSFQTEKNRTLLIFNCSSLQYDDDVINGLRANAQAYLVNTLADFVPEDVREDVEILDVAAGTGIVGELLAKIGFKKFDACGEYTYFLFNRVS